MFTRNAWQQSGGYRANMAHGYEDWDFWTGILALGGKFRRVTEPLFHYRCAGRSMLAGSDEKRLALRAQITLNHPGGSSPADLELCRAIVANGDRPPDATLRLKVVRWLFALGVPGEALEHTDALLSDDSLPIDDDTRATLSFVRGLGLIEHARFGDATAALRTTAKLLPTRADVKRKLAFALHEDGQTSAARRELQDALELDPTSSEATALAERLEVDVPLPRVEPAVNVVGGADLALHLGCGEIHIPGFVNVDIDELPTVDVRDDIATLRRFRDGSARLIYACHVLEHFATDEVPAILARWFEVLRPGGELRISVPDLDRIVKIYAGNWQHFQTPPHTPWVGLIYGGQDDRYDFHKTGFNRCYLERLLSEAGYRDIAEYPHAPHWLAIEDASLANQPFGEFVSLNVVARRPG